MSQPAFSLPNFVAKESATVPAVTSRRSAPRVASAAATVLLTPFLLLSDPALPASPTFGCYNGEGPACEAAAAESPLIRKLLEKSKENKEKNFEETRERYWREGYKDYFNFESGKVLTKQADGKWTLERPESPFAKAARLFKKDD